MLKNSIAAVVCAAVPLACAVDAEPDFVPAAELSTEGRTHGPKFRAGSLIAELEIAGGTTLSFVEVEPGDVGVLEFRRPGGGSIANVHELGAHPIAADVFYAFAEPETPMPERVLAAGHPSASFLPQGWAREVADVTLNGRAPCNDGDVTDWIEQFGWNDLSTPKIRLNQVPRNSSYFTEHVEVGTVYYYFYEYAVGGHIGSLWSNVDAFATYVGVCDIDSYEAQNPGDDAHPSVNYEFFVNDHWGPEVVIRRRLNNEAHFTVVASHDFDPPDEGTAIGWYDGTRSNADWNTQILYAGADDSFDIAHAVEEF